MLAACPRAITDSGVVLTLTPTAASLFVPDSARFTATLLDKDGSPVSAPLTWSMDNPSVATVDSSGMVRAVGSGSSTLRVSARGEVETAAITVSVDSGQTLTITPTTASMYVDGAQRFTATLQNRHGDTLPADPDWKSDNSSVASVDATGLVTARATGTATIQAKVRNLSATAEITVDPKPSSVTLVGAGDIASCTTGGDEATAKLLDGIQGTVFTAGDNAYQDGTAAEFANCYAPTWGRHKSRTRPAAGNHEYFTFGATGYYGYFGAAAGDPSKGYYSYDIGSWHIIVLNSNLASATGSPQQTWLVGDLSSHPVRCTLAIWHHPRFSSGPHGSSPALQALWQTLYDAGAEVVVVGHDHVYERFAPQTAAGQLDVAKGIREFVVGTGGGASLYAFNTIVPNSEVRNNTTRGVLKLTLYPDRYDWKFVPVAGSSFTDSGSASCH
ncbi:MAG TPA: Ig-like domain-containing protein [Gemmatimonadales bacterium]|nr:Ig-like domain-containing protein [Gemmatimonadales bacterium]